VKTVKTVKMVKPKRNVKTVITVRIKKCISELTNACFEKIEVKLAF